MIFKKIQLLFLVIFVFSACQDNNIIPDNAIADNSTISDKNTVSLEYSLNSVQNNGFSFEKMAVQNDSTSQNINSDFSVLPQLSVKGDLVSPFLVQSQLKSSFILSKQFDNLNDAKVYYDAYSAFAESGAAFDYNAIPVKPFQIWIVKTNSNQYGKIMITSTNTAYLKTTPNAIVNFKAELLK